MKQPAKLSILEDALQVLIRHFGSKRVRSSLERLSDDLSGDDANPTAKTSGIRERPATINQTLASLQKIDAEKHRVLNNFYERLRSREVLPEAEDIRQFAQLVGLKQIAGKSRRDLVPKLISSLMDVPQDRLKPNIDLADSISDRERQKGFSVLTDKLLGEK